MKSRAKQQEQQKQNKERKMGEGKEARRRKTFFFKKKQTNEVSVVVSMYVSISESIRQEDQEFKASLSYISKFKVSMAK